MVTWARVLVASPRLLRVPLTVLAVVGGRGVVAHAAPGAAAAAAGLVAGQPRRPVVPVTMNYIHTEIALRSLE